MIKVKVLNNHIEISGHAMYDDKGKDIVCASASSIVITSVNAIEKLDKEAISYIEKDGYLKIDILKESKEVNIIISNMIELLEELQEQYKKNIKIIKEVR